MGPTLNFKNIFNIDLNYDNLIDLHISSNYVFLLFNNFKLFIIKSNFIVKIIDLCEYIDHFEDMNRIRVTGSQCGDNILIYDRYNILIIYKMKHVRSIGDFDSPVSCANANSGLICIGDYESRCRIYDNRFNLINRLDNRNSQSLFVEDLDLSPSGELLAVTCEGTCAIWEPGSGALVAEIPGACNVARFSPNGLLLATTDRNKIMQYDVRINNIIELFKCNIGCRISHLCWIDNTNIYVVQAGNERRGRPGRGYIITKTYLYNKYIIIIIKTKDMIFYEITYIYKQ